VAQERADSISHTNCYSTTFNGLSCGPRWIGLFWELLQLTRGEVEAWYQNEQPAEWYETAGGWLS